MDPFWPDRRSGRAWLWWRAWAGDAEKNKTEGWEAGGLCTEHKRLFNITDAQPICVLEKESRPGDLFQLNNDCLRIQ